MLFINGAPGIKEKMINGSWEHVPPPSMGGASEYTDVDNIPSGILQEYRYASMTSVSNRPALTLSHEISRPSEEEGQNEVLIN